MKKSHLFGSALALFAGLFAVGGAPSTAKAMEITCEIQDIAEIVGANARIHVFCRNILPSPISSVRYIAVAANAPHAARFLSQAQAAMLSGKNFFVDLPTSSGTNVPGCAAGDCRSPNWFGIWH